MHNHSYENEFNLHVNEVSFSYERMSTKTRFEKEAKGNSEMTYLPARVGFRPGAICGLSLLLVLALLRGFFSGFPPSTKTNIFKCFLSELCSTI